MFSNLQVLIYLHIGHIFLFFHMSSGLELYYSPYKSIHSEDWILLPLENIEFFSEQLTWLNAKLLLSLCVWDGGECSWNLYSTVLASLGLKFVPCTCSAQVSQRLDKECAEFIRPVFSGVLPLISIAAVFPKLWFLNQ